MTITSDRPRRLPTADLQGSARLEWHTFEAACAVYLTPVLIQPMAADDVAAAVAEVVVGAPANALVEVAGPEQFRLDDHGQHFVDSGRDPVRLWW
ncbi:hypothetical protein AB0875_22415 [Micromonospora gifhornensis]|uniref:hypothetical protein n=1 Tax=Micromonospora gifhornensis TaxID=84594 RepID=UPI003453692B